MIWDKHKRPIGFTDLKNLKLVFAPKYDLKPVPISDVSFHLAFLHVPAASIKFELYCPAFSNGKS